MAKPKKKNADYWKKRFGVLEEASNAYGQQAFQVIEPSFDSALRQIEGQIQAWYGRFAKNNQITMQEARKLLTAAELKEFRWDVQEYIKYGRENDLNGLWMQELENASAKYHISRLEALKVRTQQAAEVAFGNELDAVDAMARKVFTEDYYHSIFEIQRGFNVGWEIGQIDERKLEKLIAKPWAADGKHFSERIWDSRTQLVSELHNQLTRTCILGKAPDDAIKAISKKFNTSKKQAGRLVMTEQAYFHSEAQKEAFNDLDVEEFEIVATLDKDTSEICQEMDGKHFPMKDYEAGVTAPPFHPWCRSVTVPWFEDNFTGERAARDEEGKTYYVPDNMKYADWKKSMVDGQTDGLQEVDKNGIIKEKTKNGFKKSTATTVQEALVEASEHVNNVSFKGVKNMDSLNELNGTMNHLFETYDLQELDELTMKVNKTGGTFASANYRSLFPRSKFMNNPVAETIDCTTDWTSSRQTLLTQYQKQLQKWTDELGAGRFNESYIKKTIRQYNKIIKDLEEDLKYPRHNVIYEGQEIRSVITHEFGHVIADQKIFQINPFRPGSAFSYNKTNEYWQKCKMVEDVFKQAKANGDIYKVSRYAAKNDHEFFAEVFTMYDMGIEDLPDYIVEMIERVIE